ncbi:MAG: type II toxin-antitoxin system YafQ family toxin [Tenericutes bacterium]|nr:type II toxin-antitoxin system YafQ family toxin [Mycoplasmatota bacterium]
MNYRFTVDFTKNFKKEYKRVMKQGKDISKLNIVISKIASGEMLEEKYKDHKLYDNKKFKNCRECHIEPDWLLVYKIDDMQLILLLVETGSHSELF